MSEKDFVVEFPHDLKNMIGKTVEKQLPTGETIKFVVGDITGDNKIDQDDILALRLLCQGGQTSEKFFSSLTPEQLSACDINGDGFIDQEDLITLCKKIINETPNIKVENKLNNLRNKLKK